MTYCLAVTLESGLVFASEVQQRHAQALQKSGFNPEASFILGGQISGQPHGIFMIYPQGNHIVASLETPYLQIGESKYGKPILDRVVESDLSLADAARCCPWTPPCAATSRSVPR